MLLIQNGTLHTMEDASAFEGDLLVQNGKIARIANKIGAIDGARTIDATGLHIYPGVIDAHSHIGVSEDKIGTSGNDCNESSNPITPCMRAIDAINPLDSAFHNALAAGITGALTGPGSSNPIGGQFAFIKTAGRDTESMVALFPAAMKIAFGENPKMSYGANGNMPVTRMATASLIREELFNARQYFDAAQNGGVQTDFKTECYRPLFEKKMPLKAHVHRADDILTAIRIAKEFDLDLTLDHCTEGHLIPELIAMSGFPAIVGPSLASRSKIEVEQSDFATAGVLKKAGVTVAITTDHPVSRIQYLPLCAALAAKEGMDEYAAMCAITIDAARICRVDDRTGSLKVGKDADIVAFDGNPLCVMTRVAATIVNGEIVYRGEGFTG